MANGKEEGKLEGVYKARVEYVKDPKRLGRVRVRIPCIHGDPSSDSADDYLKFDELPWASPSFMGMAGYDFGSFLVPPVGSYVWVAFEGGDTSKPVYIGGSFGKGPAQKKQMNTFDPKDTSINMSGIWYGPAGESEVPVEEFKDTTMGDYPARGIIFKSPKGHTILYDDTDGNETFSICDRVGQVIKFTCPISVTENKGNAKQRKNGRADKSTQLDSTLSSKHNICIQSGKSPANPNFSKITWWRDKLVLECGDTAGRSTISMSKDEIKFTLGNSTLSIGPSGITITGDTVNINP